MKKTLYLLLLLTIAFTAYVLIINRNSKEMTFRQKLLKAVYPAFMWLNKSDAKEKGILSNSTAVPKVSFYTLNTIANDGQPLSFTALQGKKVLLVNTASDCGYTDQYAELEKLYQQYKHKLVVIGFPSNDFKEQEKGTDAAIAQFCKVNYGVSFPLMKKGAVKRTAEQQAVYEWLTNPAKNGWNSREPYWNFSKYLVDENGKLIHYFAPAISPLDKEITDAINQ